MRISDWSSDVCSSDLDRVADLHRAHLAADRLDDAGGFVAGDRGERVRIGALDEMQVRMAESAGGGADAHLVRPGLVDDDLLDNERLAGFDQDGGFGDRKRTRLNSSH